MEGASQGAWQVSNVVDCAVFSLQNCFHSPQYPTCRYNSGKLKTWKSVEVLGDMFGWKSEICTQQEVKSELKMKIKEQSLRCVNDEIHTCTEMVGLSGEILDTFCGICYKDLGKCFNNDDFIGAAATILKVNWHCLYPSFNRNSIFCAIQKLSDECKIKGDSYAVLYVSKYFCVLFVTPIK